MSLLQDFGVGLNHVTAMCLVKEIAEKRCFVLFLLYNLYVGHDAVHGRGGFTYCSIPRYTKEDRGGP